MSACAVPLLPAPRRELPYATGLRVAYGQAPRSLSNCARAGICGLDADANDARQQADHRMFSFFGPLLQPCQARCLDLLYLVPDEMQARR
jgi:hypothetical protein